MTSRQRVTAALDFKRPDRLPVGDAPWDGLQQVWIGQGMKPDGIYLPEDMGFSDLATDRTETTDLAGKHPDRVKELSQLYDDWAARSDVIPREQLDIPEIPPGNNPLVRSPQEIKTYLETVNPVLKQHGFRTFQGAADSDPPTRQTPPSKSGSR